jgi:UDP-N-acetylglucosamine:LPS N-acetylglucosamine transferase
VISGPEPQRTIFEKLVIDQVQPLGISAMVVCGRPEADEVKTRGRVTIVLHLPAGELNRVFNSAGVILARAGYSTIMDLAATGRKAILVPTPGQTEQEYLARRLHEQGIFLSQTQSDMNLGKALKEVDNFTGIQWSIKDNLLTEQIERLIALPLPPK